MSAVGDLVTHDHVARVWDQAVVVRHGTAEAVARDNRSDFALLRLVARPRGRPPRRVPREPHAARGNRLRPRLPLCRHARQSGALPQNVNFGIKGEVAASFLRANGVTPAMAAEASAAAATQVAADGSAATAQIVCARPAD